MDGWLYKTRDGLEMVVRADSLERAKAGAHAAEFNRTGSVAAANIAARSVEAYTYNPILTAHRREGGQ